MQIIFWTILTVGLSGLVAQALLIRELLVSFYGNELTLGIILANWVVLEAIGVLIIGKYIDRVRNKINTFVTLELIFSIMLPISIYLSRTYKNFIGLAPGEAVGLYTVFLASFFILLPLSFTHGALFSAGCKIYSSLKANTDQASLIGKVYAWETLGTIIGGIVFTYLLIPYLSSFRIAFIVSVLNLTICFLILSIIHKIKLRYFILFFLALAVYFAFMGGIDSLDEACVQKQWRQTEVLAYRNSIYGNIAVTKQHQQYTFYYNGIPLITTPYPDIQFVEDFGHLPLLFHPAPRDILVVSGGAGGLINELLKHPVKKIDYVEIDPLVIEMVREYPTPLTKSELTDQRVNIINTDGRFYLKNNEGLYDIILIGLSSPSDLSTNRFFTQEFFSLTKNRLRPEGILAFWLPGSLAYVSGELKDLNSCILNSLNKVYGYVRIIPGDYNIYLASSSKNIMQESAQSTFQRLTNQRVTTRILTLPYLNYRLSQYWVDWFKSSLQGSTEQRNLDHRPFAVFKMLILWNKKFSSRISVILEYFENLNLETIAIFMIFVTGIIFYIFYLRHSHRLIIANAIASTGFFAMLANLVLIFSYQVFYGYLYHRIGLLISIFMAGTALGSILITRKIETIKNTRDLFIILEILIVIFTLFMAMSLNKFQWSAITASLIFISLFFICGLFLGLEFPLASKMYIGEKEGVGEVAGALYASDLIGGWIAGILGGIILLPVLGLFNTCMVIIMVKISSIILLGAARIVSKNL